MSDDRSRQAAGQRIGGQFKAEQHTEGGVELGARPDDAEVYGNLRAPSRSESPDETFARGRENARALNEEAAEHVSSAERDASRGLVGYRPQMPSEISLDPNWIDAQFTGELLRSTEEGVDLPVASLGVPRLAPDFGRKVATDELLPMAVRDSIQRESNSIEMAFASSAVSDREVSASAWAAAAAADRLRDEAGEHEEGSRAWLSLQATAYAFDSAAQMRAEMAGVSVEDVPGELRDWNEEHPYWVEYESPFEPVEEISATSAMPLVPPPLLGDDSDDVESDPDDATQGPQEGAGKANPASSHSLPRPMRGRRSGGIPGPPTPGRMPGSNGAHRGARRNVASRMIDSIFRWIQKGIG